jgi:hypothetical protein
LQVRIKILRKAKFIIPFARSSCLLQMTAGRIAGERWWTNQEFSPVGIIPPWLSMLEQ